MNPVLNKAGAAASYGISAGQGGLSPTFRHRKMTEADVSSSLTDQISSQ